MRKIKCNKLPRKRVPVFTRVCQIIELVFAVIREVLEYQ